MVRRSLTVLGSAAVAAAVLVGCGSSGGGGAYVEPTGPPVKTLDVSAKNFQFTPHNITAPAGILQVDLKSTDSLHALVIEGVPGFQLETTSGNTATGKVKLKPGKYTFYCDIPGHRDRRGWRAHSPSSDGPLACRRDPRSRSRPTYRATSRWSWTATAGGRNSEA